MEIHWNLPVRREDPVRIYTSFNRVETLASTRNASNKHRWGRVRV